MNALKVGPQPIAIPRIPASHHMNKAEYPRQFIANLAFRKRIYDLCLADEGFRDDIIVKCSRDILFYINTFVYTYNPKKIGNEELPFITYAFQDETILKILEKVRRGEDLLIEKSRDMGATWLVLAVLDWYFRFHSNRTFMILSRKEDSVDKTDDKDALMWKLDFLNDHLPKWLQPDITRTNLHIGNDDNNSSIDGESTNGDAGRGGRRSAMMLDEYGAVENGAEVSKATADNTNTRIFVSTPQGMGNDFADKRFSGDMEVITLHWSRHPEKAKGIHVGADMKLHSPWYDKECKRRSRIEVAQELDIDYGASDAQFFDQHKIDALKKACRRPNQQGELDFDKDTVSEIEFLPRKDGRLSLFCNLDVKGNPARDRHYGIGADISTGSGSSDSVLSVIDLQSCEKVAEWKHNKTNQVELARVAVALGRWFCGPDGTSAYMCWEANGPGQLFGKTVLELEYDNYYMDTDEKSIKKTKTLRPGFWSTPDKKLLLLSTYRNALESGLFVNPSAGAVKQCEFYVFATNGQPVHSKAASTIDQTASKNNHGDEVIADALAWKAFTIQVGQPVGGAKKNPPPRVAPAGSFKHRQEVARALERDDEEWRY